MKNIVGALITDSLFSAFGFTVSQISEKQKISRQAVSKRLAVLEKEGLLKATKVGRATKYMIDLGRFLNN